MILSGIHRHRSKDLRRATEGAEQVALHQFIRCACGYQRGDRSKVLRNLTEVAPGKAVATGTITGLGVDGYLLALRALVARGSEPIPANTIQ